MQAGVLWQDQKDGVVPIAIERQARARQATTLAWIAASIVMAGGVVWEVYALVSLIAFALILWAAWTRGRARQAIRDAGLTEGRVVSVDAIQERAELTAMRQIVLHSDRYGIAGKPDRIVQTERGPVPVDVKKSACP